MKKLKTIEQINLERKNEGVSYFTYTQERKWTPTGILCPCGCNDELLELLPRTSYNAGAQTRIKCAITKKEGTMFFDATPREIITGVKWD